MPALRQLSPDGQSMWNGVGWEPAQHSGPAVVPNGSAEDPNARQSPGPELRGDSTPNPYGITPIADQPGRSVGAQVIAAINARVAAGQPIDQGWAEAIWQAAGLSPEQAKTMASFGHDFFVKYGRSMAEGEINDAFGQAKAGAALDESKWRTPPVVGQPAPETGAKINDPAPAAVPPAPGAPDAPALPAPAAPAGPGATGVASSNHFVGTDSATHLNDLIKNNKGDLSVLAERLLSNQEGAQGGRFAAPIRSTYGDKAQQLEGLLALESANDPAFTDSGTAVADAFNQDLGAGNKYDQPGHGVGKGLLTSAISGGNTGSQAFLKGDPAAQLKALKSALEIDNSPFLQNQVDQQADEAYKGWLGQHASDPTAASAFGSFLEYAKAKNLF